MSRRTRRATAALAAGLTGALALAACGGGSGFDNGSGSGATQTAKSGPVTLKFMITSNGPADVKLQQDTVKPWEDKTGNKVEVIAASDMNQQLTQGFAAGSPPDLFFTDANVFPTYAKAGNMVAYGDQLDMKSDFYPNLVQTFTYDGKFYCAPKDFSTLALIINTDLWQQAGLTTADVPKDWSALESVAQKLTKGKVKGLVIGDTRDRVGAFMKQAGGWIVSPDQTKMTADTASNLAGLAEVKKLLASGSTAWPKTVDAGWGGEALGTGKAAMTIEGNWIKGAIKNDYPNLKWQAVELPAGPAAKGTLSFTQCYGIASASKNQAAAIDLVKYLSTEKPAMALATGLGVMPSIKSAATAYKGAFPNDAAFLAGADYAQGPVTVAGMDPVLKDFDAQLASLPGGDPKAMLERLQKNGEAVLK
ncbi:extracellular solute-binding protein [Intrasporangium sp. YIM S08009]|uniref:sugar ABC transporter substrate-binding protein n=1 Tax=Intrasporangium zincisolvens TaxID=3080018 RepID=UPI002B06109B|nr:extracellular solute-binding protein [Intrasporangium sp. YIM S08009]